MKFHTKFRQSSIAFVTSSNYHRVEYFWWHSAHIYYLPMSTNECLRDFGLDRVIWKKWKRRGLYTVIETRLPTFSHRNKLTKNGEHPSVAIVNDTRFLFLKRNTFSKAGSMFLKVSSIWTWNVSYKFWFTLSPKNGYLQCAQLCLFYFFQISGKLNLFSCRDGVYSLSMILSLF